MLRPKKFHTRNLITTKNSCGSNPPPPPHNFSNGPSLRDFSSWSPVSCVLVIFCKCICYWAWSQWLRHWSATIWDWTKDTQSFSASSGAISYPSVRRAGRREPWERVCNLSKSCIDHLFCCSNVESLSSFRRHIPTRCLEWGTSQSFEGNVKKTTTTTTTTTNAIRTGLVLWSLTFTKFYFIGQNRWIGAVPGRLWVI